MKNETNKQQPTEHRLRSATGLVVGLYVCMHLLNHSLGIISIDAMEAFRSVVGALWKFPPLTVLLYGSLVIHLSLTLRAIYRRTSLRLPAWELARIGLGLLIPVLLLSHIVATRVSGVLGGINVDYPYIVTQLWGRNDLIVKQTLLIIAVWVHFCIGMHYWLRIRPWYGRIAPVLYAFAVLVPVLAWLGFMRAGMELTAGTTAESRKAALFAKWADSPPEIVPWIVTTAENSPYYIAAVLALFFGARWLRLWRAARRPSWRVIHPEAGALPARAGMTVLEVLQHLRVPHAAVCGGRARCTTCRVRIFADPPPPPPSQLEASALERLGNPPNVRLACQMRPQSDVQITPLLAADIDPQAAFRPGGVSGHEREVVSMFVDLRGSTRLGEAKLPYDVVFVLNQFFTEMAIALEQTSGHYAQFAGDGLLALYGLHTNIQQGCRDALRGAQAMTDKLDALNGRLAGELAEPLKIGIGIHAGAAIVGTMGPPHSPLLSAIGDNVNIAARLEAQTKIREVTLVLSAEVGRLAGVDLEPFPAYDAEVRGRSGAVRVHAVADPRHINFAPQSAAQQEDPPPQSASSR